MHFPFGYRFVFFVGLLISTCSFAQQSDDSEFLLNMDYGTILEPSSHDSLTSFLWGYGHRLPIAKIRHAKVEQVAYTSFEEFTGKGSWDFVFDDADQCPDLKECLDGCSTEVCEEACKMIVDACAGPSSIALAGKTGRRSFKFGTIKRSGLPAGNYILSFWARTAESGNSGSVSITGHCFESISNSEWTYFEYHMNSVTTISLSVVDAFVDELRLYPAQASITTYTPDPMLGVMTVMDATHGITYYEYDELGRVRVIRDYDGNILKRVDYTYGQITRGQP